MTKRIDPRMHSAEHILNQAMGRLFDCGRAFSAHIEKKKSKCDYRFARALDETEVRRLEAHVNAVIACDLPVTAANVDRMQCADAFSLERLPPDAGEAIRIVRIGDYDACPCAGPHVARTAEIGRFQIISTSFAAGTLRIRFRLRGAGLATRAEYPNGD